MGGGYRRSTNDDDDVAIVVASSSKKTLKVGDEKDLWNLYEQRFKNCQQTACKLIAKAWVKVVEPKKQTNHPYTGQDEKAPDWWPKPWGPTKEEKVRHKEPDHLYKRGKNSVEQACLLDAPTNSWNQSESIFCVTYFE